MSDLWNYGYCGVCGWQAPIDQESFLRTLTHCREHTREKNHRTVLVFDPNPFDPKQINQTYA